MCDLCSGFRGIFDVSAGAPPQTPPGASPRTPGGSILKSGFFVLTDARNGSGVSFGLLQPLKDLKVEILAFFKIAFKFNIFRLEK